MKLRQVALVAETLAPVRSEIFTLLGITEDFADPGVGEFGLENSVMAIGNDFLEVVAPIKPDTTAGRLLDRRGGNGGYMVLVQVDDIEDYRGHTRELGIRKVWNIDRPDVKAFHVHPKDIGAAIVSFDEMDPPEKWEWGGPGWQDHRAEHVTAISGVELQAEDPQAIAKRWSEAMKRPFHLDGDQYVIPLDEGTIYIKQATDGRGDGVSGVEFETPDRAAIEAAAKDLGLKWQGDAVEVCGTWFRFKSP